VPPAQGVQVEGAERYEPGAHTVCAEARGARSSSRRRAWRAAAESRVFILDLIGVDVESFFGEPESSTKEVRPVLF